MPHAQMVPAFGRTSLLSLARLGIVKNVAWPGSGIAPRSIAMTWDEHYRNREAVPLAELEPYYGKHVAWNMEGTKIVASGENDLEVLQAAERAGFQSGQVVVSYIPFPDEVILGGAFAWDEEIES